MCIDVLTHFMINFAGFHAYTLSFSFKIAKKKTEKIVWLKIQGKIKSIFQSKTIWVWCESENGMNRTKLIANFLRDNAKLWKFIEITQTHEVEDK